MWVGFAPAVVASCTGGFVGLRLLAAVLGIVLLPSPSSVGVVLSAS